jgi:thiosulfate/3-mercaptopyruvate sulfurtransferase
MKKIIITISALFVTALFTAISAQVLISANDLAAQAKNPDYIIVSAELEPDYAKVHITNSVNVSYKAFYKTGNIEGLMVSDAEISKIFGDAGISEGKTVVVYDEGGGRYAGRVYWILKYMGVANAKILDGGMEAWKAGRKPVTKNPTTISKTTFNGKPNKAMLASIDEVKTAAGKSNVILVDLRETAEHKGQANQSKGYIPGSVNIDHTSLFDAKGLYKPKADLEKIFAAQGITKDKTIILYCGTGVRTGKGYVALVNLLGYNNVKIYDGGYNEWIALNNKVDK